MKKIFKLEDINNLKYIEAKKEAEEKLLKIEEKVSFLKRVFYKYLSLRSHKSNINKLDINKLNTNKLDINKLDINKINKLDINKIRRVLIFRYDGIGDYFVTTPVISWLKRNIPNVIIDVVTSKRNNSIIAQDTYINNTYIVDVKSNYAKISRIAIKEMRKNKYDLVLPLVLNRTTRAAELAVLAASEAYKVTLENRKIYANIFDLLLQRQQWIDHIAVQFYKILIEFFPDKCDISSLAPYIPIEKKYFDEAISFAQENNLEFNPNISAFQQQHSFSKLAGRKYIIINVNSSIEKKSISIEKTIKIINALREQKPDYVYFVTGDPNKTEIIKQIVSTVNSANCRELALSFNIFSVVLAGASLLISPDTATVHVAAVAGVPIIAFYVVYYAIFEWYPLSKNFTIFLADENNNSNENNAVSAVSYPSAELVITEACKYL